MQENEEKVVSDNTENQPDEVVTAGSEKTSDANSENAEKKDDLEKKDNEKPEDVEEENDVVVTIAGEEPEPVENKPTPAWVREVRKKNRELAKRVRELEARESQYSQKSQEQTEIVVGEKPKLADFNWDEDKHATALDAWFERKKKADLIAEEKKKIQEKQQEEWNARLQTYNQDKTKLGVNDYEDAEEIAKQVFSPLQQTALLQGSENPALLVYALGKNLKKAQELAKITDVIKFSFAAAKIEKELKVVNRKSVPEPERVINGSAKLSGKDDRLDKLMAEADRTGDYTKVVQYRRSLGK